MSVVAPQKQHKPETKPIAELFDELRQWGNQMAIAVDEYGGLAGMVTLKRLSEEVVGPVGEEGQGPEEEYEAIDRNTFQVDGGMSIEEANEELGFSGEMRQYGDGVAILKCLGVSRVTLLTNNPAKVTALREAGLTVRREPHTVAPKAENRDYLRTKAGKMGHLLD